MFRTAYASLGELRSIIPSDVNIMALTATATHGTFEIVKERLSLHEPIVVGVSPDRPCIFHFVVPTMELDCLADLLCNGIRMERTKFPLCFARVARIVVSYMLP